MRSPLGEPREYILKAGKTTVGRKSDHDIFVPDASASRFHAEVHFDAEANALTIRDLGSMNGTFVNRERIAQSRRLKPNDEIRIGEHILSIAFRDPDAQPSAQDTLSGTQPLTRDLVLESIDHHAILLYKVSRQLNTILELDTALREVSGLMQTSMGANKCEVVLAERFNDLNKLGFPTSIARLAIEQRSAVIIPDLSAQGDAAGKSAVLLRIRSAMCVPVIGDEEIMALIYVYKTDPLARPFDQRDLQLAVAISHQAAMTIQRAQLMEQMRKEQQLRGLLQRFHPTAEVEALFKVYQQTGHLPGLHTQTLTVLMVDIRNATALSERLGTQRFGEFITRYYQEMTEVVFEQHGLMQQYAGDGLMAVFSAAKPEPEARAVRAALGMLTKLESVSRAAGEPIEVGIGVNTGLVMAGYVELKNQVEFSVLGAPVQVVAQLPALARPNRIFIGAETYQLVGTQFKIKPLGPHELRSGGMVDVYEVLSG